MHSVIQMAAVFSLALSRASTQPQLQRNHGAAAHGSRGLVLFAWCRYDGRGGQAVGGAPGARDGPSMQALDASCGRVCPRVGRRASAATRVLNPRCCPMVPGRPGPRPSSSSYLWCSCRVALGVACGRILLLPSSAARGQGILLLQSGVVLFPCVLRSSGAVRFHSSYSRFILSSQWPSNTGLPYKFLLSHPGT